MRGITFALCTVTNMGKQKLRIFLPLLTCISYFSVDLSTTAKTTPYIPLVTTATSEVCAGCSLHYQKNVECSVLFVLLRRLMNFLVGENRNVFRFTKEDSSSSAKRNINITSEELPRLQAGSYDKRC